MAMSMNEIREGFEDARITRIRTEHFLEEIADFLVGRLRVSNISSYTLCRLKRELAKYNMQTCEWRD